MTWDTSADLQNLVQQSLQKVTEIFGELSMRKLASLLVLTPLPFPSGMQTWLDVESLVSSHEYYEIGKEQNFHATTVCILFT